MNPGKQAGLIELALNPGNQRGVIGLSLQKTPSAPTFSPCPRMSSRQEDVFPDPVPGSPKNSKTKINNPMV